MDSPEKSCFGSLIGRVRSRASFEWPNRLRLLQQELRRSHITILQPARSSLLPWAHQEPVPSHFSSPQSPRRHLLRCPRLSKRSLSPPHPRASFEWPTGLSPNDSVESAKSLSLLPPMSRASRPAGQRHFELGIDGRPIYCKLFALGSNPPLVYYETALDRPSLDPGNSCIFPKFHPIWPCRYRYRIRRQGL